MLYCLEINTNRPDPMSDVSPFLGPLLKPSLILRYDRSHGGQAIDDDRSRTAEELITGGESDMEVTGPGSVNGETPIRPTESQAGQEFSSKPSAVNSCSEDGEVFSENSDATPTKKTLREDASVRAERLARIRADIAAGTYDTPDKFEGAVERLLREIR